MEQKFSIIIFTTTIIVAALYLFLALMKKLGILSILMQVSWIYLIIAVSLVLGSYLIWAQKWYFLIKMLYPVNFINAFMALLASTFANATTIGTRVGGMPVRSYYMSKMLKKSKSEIFATVFFERSTNNIALQILAVFSIIFMIIFTQIDGTLIRTLMILLIILIIWLIIRLGFWKKTEIQNFKIVKTIVKFIYFISGKVKEKFQYDAAFHSYMKNRIQRYNELFFKFNDDRMTFRIQIFFGATYWLILHLSTFFLFKSVGTDVSFLSVVLVQTIALTIGGVSFFPGGVGIVESVMIGLYYVFQIAPGIAATVAILNRIITYFFELVLGPIFIYVLNRKYGKKKIEFEFE
jgi:glycosyltransferase 2 family protein